MGGAAAGQAIVVLASPIITRLYSQSQLGALRFYMALIMFVAVIVTLRLELAVPLPKEDRVAAALLVLGLLVVVPMSLCALGVIWLLGLYGLLGPAFSAVRGLLWVLPLGTAGAGCYLMLSSWAVRRHAYGTLAATRFSQGVGLVFTQVLLGWLRAGALGLAVADAVGRSAGIARLVRGALKADGAVFRQVTISAMWAALKRYRNFPLVSTWSALVNTGGFSVPLMLFANYCGAQILGLVALAERVLDAPNALVGQAVSQVFVSEGARLASADPPALKRLFRRLLVRQALIGLLPLGTVLAAGPFLFGLVFGAQWTAAGEYARLFAIMTYASFLAWPFTPTLTMLERQKLQFAWDISRLLLSVGAIEVAHRLGSPPERILAAYVSAMALCYLSHLVLSDWAIRCRVREWSSHASEQVPQEPEGRAG